MKTFFDGGVKIESCFYVTPVEIEIVSENERESERIYF